MPYQHTGRSIFMDWELLDCQANLWAKKTFGEHVHGATERDETVCCYIVRGFKKEDYELFKSFYYKYDYEGDYDPEEDFDAGEAPCMFPDVVTLGIINEELRADIGFHIAKMRATYEGVYFFEKDPLDSVVPSPLQTGEEM